ncbi:McrB family protein [Thioalkalivibrio sp. ALE23]|uniref:McrB family protein n=1 Tax=Thioalkalivibrio sp. ALE23 TaxID=1265495 RepID=UPI000382AF95|nr:AAA family ATPase [Thioalkalivibrio sp. ALE23]
MSRYTPHADTTALLETVEQWRDTCLIDDGSIFGDETLWTADNLAILDRAFTQNPQEGSESYSEKLKIQLADVPPTAARLMAELNWVLLLFPSNIKPETERQQVLEIWELGGTPLSADHPALTDEVLCGAGHAGTAFNTHRWRELAYMINIAKAMKEQPRDGRRHVVADPWIFARWLADVPREGFRQLRHMLNWLLFPDTFENFTTGRDKRAIVQHFEELPAARVKNMSFEEIDRRLFELRQRLEQETGHPFAFYESPWKERWQPSQKVWLLAWNPHKWPWDELLDDRLRVVKGESVTKRWSTASGQVGEGDTAYIMRLGTEPRGLIAQGNIASAPYEGEHWDPERAKQGEKAQFVDITLTDLRDPKADDILPLDRLESEINTDQQWTPQQSGIEIKPAAAKQVGTLWAKLPKPSAPDEEPGSPQQEAITIQRATNAIYYGPPGTGKTYYLQKHLMPAYESRSEDMSEDEWLVEQLAGTPWWEAVALALADLGGEATVNELIENRFFQAKARIQGQIGNPNLRSTCWSALQTHAVHESETVKVSIEGRRSPLIFDKKGNGRWFFTGDWDEAGADLRQKLQTLREGPGKDSTPVRRHQLVTFHQSYSYEDFVEGIRPQTTDGVISYEVYPGVFKEWCNRARLDPHHRYALFIDEINRGNIARIFGELITLVEPDKRAWWDSDGQRVEGVEVILPYSGERFGVPKNLDIYATMNTADRSIALMDAALRRRFRFREMLPKPQAIAGQQDGRIPDDEGGQLDLRRLLDTINRRLRYLLHRDQAFGHAYFTEVKHLDGLRDVLVYDIIPMLAEYFYDDWAQIRRVLSDEGVSEEYQIITRTTLDPLHLFGDGAPGPEKPDYHVKAPGDIAPDAIRKIYENVDDVDE